jgi:hypothetical protein
MRAGNFLISKMILVMILGLPLNVSATAGIGKVIVSVGKVEAVNTEGVARSLKRRSAVFATDTVTTYEGSKAQLRFTDGSMVSLSQNSLFKIEEYEFGGDGGEKAVYNLLKGGLQTITGAIGHVNKQDYTLKTPVATIGIRGTFYQIFMTPSGGMVGFVKEGGIVVKNAKGAKTNVQPGQYFAMASATGAAVISEEPPAEFKEAEAAEEQESEQEEGDGTGTDANDKNDESADSSNAGAESKSTGDTTAKASGDAKGAVELSDGQVTITATADTESATGVNTNPGSFDETAGGSAAAVIEQGDAVLGGKLDLPIRGGAVSSGALGLAFLEKDAAGQVQASRDALIIDANHSANLDDVTPTNGTTGAAVTYIEVQDSTAGEYCDVCQFSAANATLEDRGDYTPFGVIWGRWIGDFVVADNGVKITPATTDFHYIYSDQLTAYAELEQITGTANFQYEGGPTPRDSLGDLGTVNSIVLGVDFDSMTYTNASISVTAASGTYAGALTGGAVDISRSLATELTLDTGRMSAQFVGSHPAGTYTAGNIGIMTTYELQGSAGLGTMVGTALLK